MENEIKNEAEMTERQYYGSAFQLKKKEGDDKQQSPAYSVVIDADMASSLEADEGGYVHLSLRERQNAEEGRPTHSLVETYKKQDGTYDDLFSCKDIVIKKSEIERLAIAETYGTREVRSAYLYAAPSGELLPSKSKYPDMPAEERRVRGRGYEPGRYFKDITAGFGWLNPIKDAPDKFMTNITIDVTNALQARPDKDGKLHFCLHKSAKGENSSKPDLRMVPNRRYENGTTDVATVRDLVIPQAELQKPENCIGLKLEISGSPAEERKQAYISVDPQGKVSFNKYKYPGRESWVIEGAAAYEADREKNIAKSHEEIAERHEKRRSFKL